MKHAWIRCAAPGFFSRLTITSPGRRYKSRTSPCKDDRPLANVRPWFPIPVCRDQHRRGRVIVRENEEDLYAGIARRPSGTMFEMISSQLGKDVRYDFETHGEIRRKVTASQRHIMKLRAAFLQGFYGDCRRVPILKTNTGSWTSRRQLRHNPKPSSPVDQPYATPRTSLPIAGSGHSGSAKW